MVSLDMPELTEGSTWWPNGQTRSIKVNPRHGSGYLYEVVSFQNDISVVFQNFSLHGQGDIRLFSRETVNPPLLTFPICFSGVGHISYTKSKISLVDGFAYIELPGYEPSLYMELKSNTPIRSFSVCMEPAIFEKLTGKSLNKLAEALDFLDWRVGERNQPTRLESINFVQKLCAYQAFDSFMNNPQDRLFLEAKALELVALQIKQLDHLTEKIPQKQVVDHHAEKIAYACAILRKEMAKPPDQMKLANRVGLNHNHLIQGFKQILGVCPFEYLRAIRLEKARDLIASRECNVTQAAFNVGYSSLSHFTKTFREKFGINPKAFATARKTIN